MLTLTQLDLVALGQDGADLDGMDWSDRIRDALASETFELYSQPIIPLTGGVAREELLLRMNTPDGCVVCAREFLPAAQRLGLSLELLRGYGVDCAQGYAISAPAPRRRRRFTRSRRG